MAVGSSNDFDLVVLGAGTGGYTAAFRAAQLGLRVALVDEDKIGGTCLHRGCIPTKALLESAEMMNRARQLKDYGVVLPGEPAVDYAAMAARRDQVVKRMWTGLKSLVDKNKVAWVQGRGRLEGPRSDPGEPARRRRDAGRGWRSAPPGDRRHPRDGQPGEEPAGPRPGRRADPHLATTSCGGTTAPASIVIVGAGAVGVEFASFFNDIGTTGDPPRVPARGSSRWRTAR